MLAPDQYNKIQYVNVRTKYRIKYSISATRQMNGSIPLGIACNNKSSEHKRNPTPRGGKSTYAEEKLAVSD